MGQVHTQHGRAAAVLGAGQGQAVAKGQRVPRLDGPGRLQRGGIGFPGGPGLVAAHGGAGIAARHGLGGGHDLVVELDQRLVAGAPAAVLPQGIQPGQAGGVQGLRPGVFGRDQHRGIDKYRGHAAPPGLGVFKAFSRTGLTLRATNCAACGGAPRQVRSSVRQAR